MRGTLYHRRRGQVLVMVTLALFAMCGMIGLVVDLGWSYFVRKSAQTAADAAALAAVRRAMDLASNFSDYQCTGGTVACAPSPVDCPSGATGNLVSACVYAQQHGFTTGGRQTVLVQASDQTPPTVSEACGQGGATVHHPPTAGCVDTYYWVSVSVAERIPQLFSSIFGNTEGIVSAKATAGVVRVEQEGSLILINREGDVWNPSGGGTPNGENLYVGGTPNVIVPGGILLASNAHGPGNNDPWAGYISGSGTVDAPYTHIRTGGSYDISGGGSWLQTPDNLSDGGWFQDPYRNVYGIGAGGQPPVTSTVLTARPVLGGNLSAALCGGPCPSGNYYATKVVSCGPGCSKTVATGDQIQINSDVTFDGGSFGNFNFFGGVNVGQAQVTFGPGRYVMAGVNDLRNPTFNNDNRAALLSAGANGTNAGRIFILTDSTYPGLAAQVATIPEERIWPGAGGTLYFSKSSFKAGNNSASRTELFGLNEGDANLPPELKPFALSPVSGQGAGVVIWQDQRNSFVQYDSNGQVACGNTAPGCPNPDPAIDTSSDSPQLELWATPFADYEGVVYQPRGAWTMLQAAGDYQGALRVVSGALKIQGAGVLDLSGVSPPLISFVPALIE